MPARQDPMLVTTEVPVTMRDSKQAAERHNVGEMARNGDPILRVWSLVDLFSEEDLGEVDSAVVGDPDPDR